MAGIIYELVDVLEQEKECYEGLKTLCSYTETAVVNKNMEFLQEVIKSEEAFIGRLNVLGKKRDELMNDIAVVTGMKAKEVTVTKIIEKIGEQTEMGIKLSKIKADITAQLTEIQNQSKLNKQMISDSLELVDFTVNAIMGATGYAQTRNYNGPGKIEDMQRGQSMFDQKQ